MSGENPESEQQYEPIEIGLVVAGTLDEIDRKSLDVAVESTRRDLEQDFPEFKFLFRQVQRPELSEGSRVQPSVLLQQATEDRDSRHWDFVLLVTGAELVGNYTPYCFAALSRPLDGAVISMSLVDPEAMGAEIDTVQRVQRIAQRVATLFRHSLGHLLGLPQDDRSQNILFHPST
ncbi:MAG: hypothetical protein HKN47_07195, partial [Pirellulaceae bacterium]|nr:hypothetical protein [Pirellulaceae bacterium]